ncbi:hypothetical protein N658DRAFT_492527 [Parathielavia hyrcaniae]|uniref:Uncharacterized protein n=1 Tax=Parathielavia hyrcaniae TaxID=113614 RepID=A0AAN6Q6E0_9PEZI|nr:hypothetical protein N658DRAFT_492527 [Parathielavia hyrcaniae]
MLDSSYSRSRVYFKTLEFLRIFSDTIRETGRDLEEMYPGRLRPSRYLPAAIDVRGLYREDTATDRTIWENWRFLTQFQAEAEDRLLRKVSQMTEEIKICETGFYSARRH